MLNNKNKLKEYKTKTLLVALAFCIAFAGSAALDFSARANASQSAANAAAGSADDPLITLSYLNSVLAFAGNSGSGSYIVLELSRGQRVRAKNDSIEIILRPGGAASVISQYAALGVADLTSGTELLDGEDLPINHLVLIPRADGRAIIVTSDKAFVMARGDYEIF